MMQTIDISCALPRPDIAQLSEDIRSEFSKRLLGGAPVYPLSSEDILAFVMAGVTNLMWGFVNQALIQSDPEFMCCDVLVRYAAKRGLNIANATRAKGYVAVTGNANAVIPATIRFVGTSSREYKLDPGVLFNPIRLNAEGAAVLRIVSTLGGTIYNIPLGTELTVSSTTPGIDGTATVLGNGITGGTDIEDCEHLRKRVLAADSAGAISTNSAWFIERTMQYPGVTRVCLEECGECCDPQFLALYPFMDGVYGDTSTPDYGVPPCDVLEEMNLWMFGSQPGKGFGLAPIGIVGAYLQARPTIIDIRIDCYRGCENIAHDLLESRLREFMHEHCVGSKLCKDEVHSMIYEVMGANSCLSGFAFDTEDGIRYQDKRFIYFDCGRFPVFGKLMLEEAYS